jgi:hypothetical protein
MQFLSHQMVALHVLSHHSTAMATGYSNNRSKPVCLLAGGMFGHHDSGTTHLLLQRRDYRLGFLPSVRHQNPLHQHLFHPRQQGIGKGEHSRQYTYDALRLWRQIAALALSLSIIDGE